MYGRINKFVGIAALLVFSWAQHQGWNLFEDSADRSSGHSSGSSRSYHK
jgi:hypothetical protein